MRFSALVKIIYNFFTNRITSKYFLSLLYLMSSNEQDREYEEGAAGTKVKRTGDSTKDYESNEPMSPAKIREHEPTAVKREMTEQIGESSQTSSDEAKERARRSGMAKGTAGADETGSEYEQGAAGANK
jgi:hypothetical protein